MEIGVEKSLRIRSNKTTLKLEAHYVWDISKSLPEE